jgi:hypothetical protein
MAENTVKSMHDIASLIRTPEEEPAPAEAAELPLDEGKESVVEEDEIVEVEEDAEEEILEASDEPLEEGVDEEEDAGDDDAAEPTGEDGFIDIRDDDMIEVKIDGEVVLRSVSDAKKALSGEGAIDKRLKEATETRKQVQADHTMLLEQFSVAHKNLMKTVAGMENVVFKPMVEKPDAALRQANPNQYLAQIDAYEADQKRVEEGKSAIRALVQQQQEALQSDIQTYREGQTTALLQSIPDLGDSEIAPKLLEKMSKLAMEKYGYSSEEIQQASDHRLYKMIYDLTMLNDARTPAERKASTVKNLDSQAAKRPRKLRSGATALKARARQQADAQKKAADHARKSGKVKDVAATLIRKG